MAKSDVTSNKWGPSREEKGSIDVETAQGRKEGAKKAAKAALKNHEDKGTSQNEDIGDEIIARLDLMKQLKAKNEK
jgi:hypothetical protein